MATSWEEHDTDQQKRSEGLPPHGGPAQRLPAQARRAESRRRGVHPLPRVGRPGGCHPRATPPRPGELRQLRQHRPRLRRQADEPHHQPDHRDRPHPARGPGGRGRPGARPSFVPGLRRARFPHRRGLRRGPGQGGPGVRRAPLLLAGQTRDRAGRPADPHPRPQRPARGPAGSGGPGRERRRAVVPQLRPQDARRAGGLFRGAHRHLGQAGEALLPQPPGRYPSARWQYERAGPFF